MTLLKVGLCPSLTKDVLGKLFAKGIRKVDDFVTMNPEKITATCHIPFKKVICIRQILLEQYSCFPVNGLNLYEESLQTLAILPTGCANLDDLLGVGIYTGEVTELVGIAASGKTQMCISFSLEISAMLEQNVIFIDTKAEFSPDRVLELLKTRFPDKPVRATLNRIRVASCQNISQLLEQIASIRANLLEVTEPFYNGVKMIIIDSVTPILHGHLSSAGIQDGRSLVRIVAKEVNCLTSEFAVSVVTTNDLVTQEGTSELKPALGLVWTNAATTRLQIDPRTELPSIDEFNNNKEYFQRKITLVKSPRLQLNEACNVALSKSGFV